jgi:uncharacterized coiled-coil protein SlyX
MADQNGNIDDRLNALINPSTEEQKTVDANQETMPVSKEETVTPQVSEPVTVDEEAEALLNSKNPERTKGYIEKLKQQINDLKAPKQEVTGNFGESVFDAFHPEKTITEPTPTPAPTVQAPYLNPQQVQNLTQQYIDADGNVDIQGLNKAVSDANQNAYQAQQRLQTLEQKIARSEETQQAREAHALFPEIDPLNKEKFNPKLFEAVTDRTMRFYATGQLEGYGGTVRLVDIARQVIGDQPQVNHQQIEQEAIRKYEETKKSRNQGPFESASGERQPDTTLSDLRSQTRAGGEKGDKALDARLKALGI